MSHTIDRPLPSGPERPPILEPGHTLGSVTDQIAGIVLGRSVPFAWLVGLLVTGALVLLLLVSLVYLFIRGTGIWGIRIPVAWAFDITNFVWWIGIGHAGTLISAILLLFRQQWRTSINRFAEAMTLFAVLCASLFPIIHLGRPWFFFWLMPYPNTPRVWPQFRSPLPWDVFALTTYGLVSLLFWYTGLLPDLATLRDRAEGKWRRLIFGFLALGWRGSARHWLRFQKTYFLLAAIATPLVVSVHSIVSLDFAVSILPGWHVTIFPPYFVSGALFSGFAMVLVIAIPLRAVYGLKGWITMRHLDNMAKIMLAAGLGVTYGYLMEAFMAWYSGSPFESYMLFNRLLGTYAPLYWALILFNVLVPQLLWFRRVRTDTRLLFIIAVVINVGMWLERFIIIVTSLHRDFLTSSWATYTPTFWEFATLFGTIGLFFALLLLFFRFLPMISMFEMRELVATGEQKERQP